MMTGAMQKSQEVNPDSVVEALSLSQVFRRFGKVSALTGLSFTVMPGELFGLVGPDGAGKTTAIRILSGLMAADTGEVKILGSTLQKGGSALREAIGYMPQQYSLYGDLSVDENLSFFGRLFGLPRAVYGERRQRLLDLTRLKRFGDRRAIALSGGMYKKLALACALLHRPRVLLLDEPTNGVDPVSRRELWDLLYEFVAEGMTVLLATPYMDEAERCHRLGLINHGRLLAEGRPDQMIQDFHHHTLLLNSPERASLEQQLEDHHAVLALTPHGASLRAVIQSGQREAFSQWISTCDPSCTLKPIQPNFEDVFLGLLAERRALGEGA